MFSCIFAVLFILFDSVCIFFEREIQKKMTKFYTFEVDKDLEGTEEEKIISKIYLLNIFN